MFGVYRRKGLDPSYFRPREDEVLEAYRQAAPYLTNSESVELRGRLERERVEHRRELAESHVTISQVFTRLDEMQRDLDRLKEEREG